MNDANAVRLDAGPARASSLSRPGPAPRRVADDGQPWALCLPSVLIEQLEAAGSTPRALQRRLRVRAVRRGLERAGFPAPLTRDAIRAASARATLLRRLAYLQRTRRLFAMWHVFHQPLAYVMFAIVLVHIGVALYLGYAFLPGR